MPTPMQQGRRSPRVHGYTRVSAHPPASVSHRQVQAISFYLWKEIKSVNVSEDESA